MTKIIDGHGPIFVKESAEQVVALMNDENLDSIMIKVTEEISEFNAGDEILYRPVWINKYDIVRIYE